MLEAIVEHIYRAKPGQIFEALASGRVLSLTGAVSVDFSDGVFELNFPDRGAIRGRVLNLDQNHRLELEWNVSGFGRDSESTLVEFTVEAVSETQTKLRVHHTRIPTEASASAKSQAWQSIFRNLESHASDSRFF